VLSSSRTVQQRGGVLIRYTLRFDLISLPQHLNPSAWQLH
jgi:hypothetical protein